MGRVSVLAIAVPLFVVAVQGVHAANSFQLFPKSKVHFFRVGGGRSKT